MGKHDETDKVIGNLFLVKERENPISFKHNSTDYSLAKDSTNKNMNLKYGIQTNIQPRIVLKMKKSETGDRWLSESLSNNTKSKQIVKRRSLLRKMKTRFLCSFSNFIFKLQDVKSNEYKLFVGK